MIIIFIVILLVIVILMHPSPGGVHPLESKANHSYTDLMFYRVGLTIISTTYISKVDSPLALKHPDFPTLARIDLCNPIKTAYIIFSGGIPCWFDN